MHEYANDLADLLFGDRRAAAQHYNELFGKPEFGLDWWETTKEPGRRAYERYLQLLPRLRATDIVTDLKELVALHEQATVVDPHLGALLTVQINLVLGTLLEQHSQTGEVATALSELLEGRSVGAYILTEVGHGSDLPNLETTATYDPSDGGGFILNTPTDTAIKFMPTTAPPPVGGVARFGIVFARLVLDGTGRGNYPFLVRLVDADGTIRPGITIRPLPDKALGMDNSITRFDHVRVSRECLLSHTGTRIDENGELVSPIRPDNQVWRAISRVRLGRLCISAMAAAVSRAALSIAVQHATQRDIAGMAGGRIPLVNVPAHRDRLIDAVADTYVASMAVEVALDAFEKATDDEQAPDITDLVALTKHLATSTALQVSSEVRDRLGAQGVFDHNQIVVYRALRDAAATAEGDSYVIALQAAYRRLRGQRNDGVPGHRDQIEACDIDTPNHWLDWMAAREAYLLHRAQETYANVTGDRQARWDSVYDLALAAAEAHVVNRAVQALADRARRLPSGPRKVAENLLVLFAIRQCLAHGADMYPDGPLPKISKQLVEMRRELHELLAPHLPSLVDAFELPTGLLGTAFGSDTYVAQYADALKQAAGQMTAVDSDHATLP
ncbi:acyl-CoA dehydrogenase family protein [Nocardia brevicatena]|uniref:acyl-CoA dehydrogenase family protein n=1 Tax=Nocardia brevicatena TaxID=37327 RepID=UPI0002F67B8C|nr:acyl-CoA dehydrogenase family protein [Nocardia brevicatena]